MLFGYAHIAVKRTEGIMKLLLKDGCADIVVKCH
jgi:hypothetical protein